MTTPTKQVDQHYESAKEVLAGHAGARAWIQDLAAKHLLRYQDSISEQPAQAGTEKAS